MVAVLQAPLWLAGLGSVSHAENLGMIHRLPPDFFYKQTDKKKKHAQNMADTNTTSLENHSFNFKEASTEESL